ncbi:PhzF family phenazine biosynthesis protein [Saccharopolyspora sp. ASAGF58]|uniref:PhzF family phenazine biosynthesis protein n=1 Tax=Saccharopolyspora sp. ASAGF58 TaxID=2719023 RepID=UPI00143FC3F7|nr:PhzF family phenazine biosynthesis isomerase [Saccharopolyspora sp. ASAGF58]QIZ35959.1 PhzF family phenazine biosynthesis protein [Saccharopolyspora sp. ASAGF58]
MPNHAYVITDVFTATPLEGNPLAVFIDAASLSAEQMQRIAREMNLSETTFVLPAREVADARVRIFTPVNELPFAGHPTLGTAIVLGAELNQDTIRLETEVGVITFSFERANGKIVAARMLQPIPSWQPYEHADELLEGLGVAASELPVDAYRNGPRHVYVGLGSVAALEAIHPDLRVLAKFPDMAALCFAGAGTNWRLRMFSPAYGVAEDPATGSAAGPLAVHLARYGRIAFGSQITIRQGVEIGRPSTMYATVEGAGERIDQVEVVGAAVVVAHGTLVL